MKLRSFKSIGSISFSVLLIYSLFVIANSSVSLASGTDSDEVAAASGSNRFAVWSDEGPGNAEIFFRRSTDNGATWKSKLNLSDTGLVEDFRFPQVAASGTNVFVVWENGGGGSVDILFRRSIDNGINWQNTINLSNDLGLSTGPQIGL